jgi:chorismate synthase
LPVGLGEPFFDSVESLISHIVFSIPAIKGIEFGSGFGSTRMKGSENNDVILNKSGKTSTNNAGGINGGITNGNDLVFRVAVKPTPSIGKEQSTIDMQSGKNASIQLTGRFDTCIALRVPVILEAATAIVLADLKLLEKK